MLQMSYAPRPFGENLLVARTDQQQIGQDRDAKGLLDPCFLRADLVCAQSKVRLQLPIDLLDVIVTTHKTIALVFRTQVYKLKRDMTRTRAVAVSSRTFMQTDVMEVNDETPAHPPATDGGRPASVGAPS